MLANHLPLKALLLLDNAPSHPPATDLVEVTDDGQIWVMYMPPNVTPLIQPMDQNAIRLTKLFYRNSLLTKIFTSNVKDINQSLKDLTLMDAVELLTDAWAKITTVSLRNCWNKILYRSFFDYDEEDDIPLDTVRRNEEIVTMRNTLMMINSLFPEVSYLILM